MNDVDHQLSRLLAAAKQGPSAPEPTAPFGLETRVLAEWRALREGRPAPAFAPLFRQVLIWSIGISCLAIISFLRDWQTTSHLNSWGDVGMRIANSELQRHIP